MTGYEQQTSVTTDPQTFGLFSAGPLPSDSFNITAAYQVTLTNTSSNTAAVAALDMAFYDSSGSEVASGQDLTTAYITPGNSQMLTYTARVLANGYSPNYDGNDSAGMPATGTASCRVVQWEHP